MRALSYCVWAHLISWPCVRELGGSLANCPGCGGTAAAAAWKYLNLTQASAGEQRESMCLGNTADIFSLKLMYLDFATSNLLTIVAIAVMVGLTPMIGRGGSIQPN